MISILLLLPLMTAPAIAALMWKLMTNPNFGDPLLFRADAGGAATSNGPRIPDTALMTVVLVDMWVYTPFIMILLLAGLRSLPKQPFEAAALDGVPRRFVFTRITLPMLMPYMVTAALFRLLDSIEQFDIIYPMTQGGPGDTLLVFQVRAYLEFYQYTNVGKSAALLIILWAITYALSNMFIKQWHEVARTRARPRLKERRTMEHTSPVERALRARSAGFDRRFLPLPDLLDLLDVVSDERADPAHSAEPFLHANAFQLRRR